MVPCARPEPLPWVTIGPVDRVVSFTPADRWDASQTLAHQFERAFQPLG